MKNILYSTLLIGLLISCTLESDEAMNKFCNEEIVLEEQQYPQTWRLVKMTTGMTSIETTGSDMDWQETIVLNADGSFIKSRDDNSNISQASGTYSSALSASDELIELTLSYTEESNLIGSCYGQLIEKYLLMSNCKLVGTWGHCDGPVLEYKRQ